MSINLRLAWRYLWGRKLRTTMTTLAIMFGVMIVFGLNGLIPAMQEALRRNMMVAANQVDLTVTSETRGSFDASYAQVLRDTPGVSAASATLSQPVTLPASLAPSTSEGRPLDALVVLGLDLASYQQVRQLSLVDGRLLQPGDMGVALMSETLAQSVALRVGDILRLPSAVGISTFEIVGLYRGPLSAEVSQVLVPLTDAQTLAGVPGKVNALEALFAADQDPEVVRQAIVERLGPGFKLGENEAGSEMLAAVQMGKLLFGLFGLMALVMGSFVIFITFRTVVAERRQDIGILRSIGASRRTVTLLVLSECLLQGVVGTIAGLAAGYALTAAMLAGMSGMIEQLLHVQMGGPVFAPETWATAIAVGLGMTLVGGLLPARAASRVAPLDALRPSQAEVSWAVPKRRARVGLVLIVLAVLGLVSTQIALASLGAVLFLVGLLLAGPVLVRPITSIFGGLLTRLFAREGLIARGNIVRQPERSSITASTMMIGLAILLSLAGLVSTAVSGIFGLVDKTLGADFLLMPQSMLLASGNVGAGPQLAQAMRDIPGIGGVTTLRVGTTRRVGTTPSAGPASTSLKSLGGSADLQLLGIDPVTYPAIAGLEFLSGNSEEAFAQLGGGRAVILNGIYAMQSGSSVGDTVTLETLDGPQDYTVVGIGMDFLNAKLATAYVSQDNLARDWKVTSDVLLMANLAPRADAAIVEAELRAVASEYPAFTVYQTAAWQAQILSQVRSYGGILYPLMLALAIPSLIALINTLGINVLERTREIGVLRAVGATRRQIKRMIMAESLLLAAIGTAFGVLAGLWLGWVLVGAMGAGGIPVQYMFPYAGTLVAIAVGLLFGVVAALIPARQAARLQIVAALQYE